MIRMISLKVVSITILATAVMAASVDKNPTIDVDDSLEWMKVETNPRFDWNRVKRRDEVAAMYEALGHFRELLKYVKELEDHPVGEKWFTEANNIIREYSAKNRHMDVEKVIEALRHLVLTIRY